MINAWYWSSNRQSPRLNYTMSMDYPRIIVVSDVFMVVIGALLMLTFTKQFDTMFAFIPAEWSSDLLHGHPKIPVINEVFGREKGKHPSNPWCISRLQQRFRPDAKSTKGQSILMSCVFPRSGSPSTDIIPGSMSWTVSAGRWFGIPCIVGSV